MRTVPKGIWVGVLLLGYCFWSAGGEGGRSSVADKKISLEGLRNQPTWKKVREWISDQTGLPAVGSSWPTGTLDFSKWLKEKKSYSIGEVMDILNEVFGSDKDNGFVLLRQSKSVILFPADQKIPPEYLSVVPPQMLEKWGKTEWVKTRIPLKNRKADDIVKQIRKLLGPYGEAKASKRGDEIYLQDTAGRLRNICRAIDKLASATGEDSDSQQKKEKKYSIEGIRGETKFKKILEWLSDQTLLPVIARPKPPNYKISFPEEKKEYTIGEIIDILNTQLQSGPNEPRMIIVRRPKMLLLYPADVKFPENLTDVLPNELDRWGKTELVKTRVRLKNRKAADIVKQIQKLLGTHGEAVASESGNEITLRDAAGRIRDICRAIEKLDQGKLK